MIDPTSNIGRWVTFVFGPLALLAAGVIAAKASTWFGLNLDPTTVAALILSVVFSVGGLLYKWLHNRGVQEVAHLAGTSDEAIERIAARVIAQLPPPPSTTPTVSGAPPAGTPPPEKPEPITVKSGAGVERTIEPPAEEPPVQAPAPPDA